MFFIFFIINIFSYFLILKFFLFFFGNKYIFPVRIAELLNLGTNLILNIYLNVYFLESSIVLNITLINFGLFFICYSICSMISTSPRTKILLDLYRLKKIDKNLYLKKFYNEKIVLNNRIKRLLTNNEIIYKRDKSIFINKKGVKFFSIVAFFFYIMKKI